jgi:uncharacterized protein
MNGIYPISFNTDRGDYLCADVWIEIMSLHGNVDSAHNCQHILDVVSEVHEAISHEDYSFLQLWQKYALLTAAYLHEVDDVKLNIKVEGAKQKDSYPNARALLIKNGSSEEFNQLVLEVISYVSTRTNHNNPLPQKEKWKLIVRDADRVMAIGEVGIARCYVYTQAVKKPLFTPETPRCKTKEELAQVATAERFASYCGKSSSMIDHFYDKLLHIDEMKSGNTYLQTKAKTGLDIMINFLLDFGAKDTLDREYLDLLAKRYCHHNN